MSDFSFRPRHNLLISIIDYLTTQVSNNWTGVSVVKSFAEVTQVDVPVVCVMLGDPRYTRLETGSTTMTTEYVVVINIFAKSDSNRMDLTDFIITQLMSSFTYSTCVNTTNHTVNKTTSGTVTLLGIDSDMPIEADESTNKKERFRQEIIARVRIDAS
jgi:hypothetical protein